MAGPARILIVVISKDKMNLTKEALGAPFG